MLTRSIHPAQPLFDRPLVAEFPFTKLALTFFPPVALAFLSSRVILGRYAGLLRTRFLCFSPVDPDAAFLRGAPSESESCCRSSTGDADRESVKSSITTVVMSSADSYAASACRPEGPARGAASSSSESPPSCEPSSEPSSRSLSVWSGD